MEATRSSGYRLLRRFPHSWRWLLPCAGIFLIPLSAADSRIRTAAYDPQEVYRLEGRVGYQIDIQFERGESFVGLGAGDVQGLTFLAAQNHLFLKPKAPRVATNLTVLTSRRDYHFEYFVPGRAPEADSAALVYVLRFLYTSAGEAQGRDPSSPDAAEPGGSSRQGAGQAENLDQQHPERKVDALLDQPGSNESQNLDYWFCGSPALRPLAAADDGVHTRLRFAPRSELPAVFASNEDGSESLLNFSMQDGEMIIHRVAHRFVVRRGRLAGCIVNAGFTGSGARVSSGTISPLVERATRGGRP